MTEAQTESMNCRLIMEHDDIYINEDVTYMNNLLQHINTINHRTYNDQCNSIALVIYIKNNRALRLQLVDTT